MWFKSASVFHFLKKCKLTPDSLQESLQSRSFKPVNSRQLNSYGWVAPNGNDRGDEDELLVHATSGFMLIKARREERILPASVITEHVNERARMLEEKFDRKIRGKEKAEIRENVVMELTPQAFTRSSYDQILIMPEQDLLVVDTSSTKKVDECVSLLRDSIETLPIKPVQTDVGQAALFTRWLKGTRKTPKDLILGDECVLQDEDEAAGYIRCNKQDLSSAEIKALSTTGKYVTKVALESQGTVSFVLDDEFVFHKIKFIQSDPDDVAEELDAQAVYDANMTLMALEFSNLFPSMIEVFGGLKEE